MTHKFYYRQYSKIICLCLLLVGMGGLLSLTNVMIPLWIIQTTGAIITLYVYMICRPAIVITDKTIRLDFSAPVAWKNISYGQIKTVKLCGKPKKILSLVVDKKVPYPYSFLQRHNGPFGPFPIPLYGLLSQADESALLSLIRHHIPIKNEPNSK